MPREETPQEREACKPAAPVGWRCPRCGKEHPYAGFARRCYESHVLTESLSSFDPEDAKYETL